MRIRKLFGTLLCLFLISGIVVTAGATDVMPFFSRVSSAKCSLTVSSVGVATAEVKVISDENDTLQGTVELKRITDQGEQSVATWDARSTMRLAEKFTHHVTSGHTYKVYASINVFSAGGVYCETVHLESSEVRYG